MQKVLFILGELSDDDIDWIIAIGHREEVPGDYVLIHEGQPVSALYLVLEGEFGVSVAALDNEEVARLVSGDVVGEMSFLDSRPPSATVTALKPSLVLTIPRQQLEEKLRLDMGFASRFYRALAVLLSSRLRGTTRRHLAEDHESPSTLKLEDLSGDASENMALAKVRFDWLLRRLKSGAIEG